MEKKDLKSMTLEELTEFVKELGEKPFRAKQLYQWMHEKLAASLDECTNLPKAFREKLAENSTYTSLRTVKMLESGIDGTRKYLFGLDDGNVIESVLMKYHHGNSVCISGRLPHGLPVLCVDSGRTYEKLTSFRDAGSDLPDPEIHGRARFQCGGHGKRRADGQL